MGNDKRLKRLMRQKDGSTALVNIDMSLQPLSVFRENRDVREELRLRVDQYIDENLGGFADWCVYHCATHGYFIDMHSFRDWEGRPDPASNITVKVTPHAA